MINLRPMARTGRSRAPRPSRVAACLAVTMLALMPAASLALASTSNDCGTGGDAADHIADAPVLALPLAACEGTLGGSDPQDWFAFDARVGDVITVDVRPTTAAFDVDACLYRPGTDFDEGDAAVACDWSGPVARLSFPVDEDGTWAVDILPWNEGTYAFTASLREQHASGRFLAGTGVSLTPLDHAWIRLDAPATGDQTVELAWSSPVPLADLDVRFFDADGARVPAADACATRGDEGERCPAPAGAEWARVDAARGVDVTYAFTYYY